MDRLLWRCSVPALHLLLARHSASSFPASTRAFSRWYPRDEISRYDQPKIPVNTGIITVPEGQAFVVERLGEYLKTLHPGINRLIPFIDRIAYAHSLKEQVIRIPDNKAVTKDNISLDIDSVLYVKTIDPYLASYVMKNPIFALVLLAQTTMRSELGKMTLDNTMVLKEMLNDKIVTIINNVATGWGLNAVRYEIGDISPPRRILQAMELEATAERKKQVQILLAKGEAEVILARSKAVVNGITLLSDAMRNKSCMEATVLGFADQYVKADSEKTAAQFIPEADHGETVAWHDSGGPHDRQQKPRRDGGGRLSHVEVRRGEPQPLP
ncbi:unnamed protein product [Urochloa decumbens]|uniref:Band 7 domain-containing protein n=1 Tax=Urochloa decumbens TaxID=240449 RepID=A0ABC9BXP0_9POAL